MSEQLTQKDSLLGAEQIADLEAMCEGVSGYFYRMLDYLNTFIREGVGQGRFTEEQARQDREIALWYSYICNNIDDYDHYYMAAQWMEDSEKNAGGCGTWYYRYSVALMYCGRLEKALEYAETGGREEPDYAWGWLQVGKLRSHFGDKEGALEAVRRGLALEPGDFEFLTLREEIEKGCTLEEMEYHWIDPECDRKLQEGLDEDATDKQYAIAGIRCDQKKLERVKELFPLRAWEADCPYCAGFFSIQGREVELVFRMNQAALSKMNTDWLKSQKTRLEKGTCLTSRGGNGKTCPLQAILFDRNRVVTLVYQDPESGESFQTRLQADCK